MVITPGYVEYFLVFPGSPTVPRGSPVSVYLFPGEAPKLPPPVVIDGEGSELDGLVATATEVQADMMSEEGSEGSEDNEDFCILEAPGMGIPVRFSSLFHLHPPHLTILLTRSSHGIELCDMKY